MLKVSPVRSFAKLGARTKGDEIQGGYVRVRESYFRSDVRAPSIISDNEDDDGIIIVPTASTLDAHLDSILACGTVTNKAIILGSVVNRLKSLGYGRTLQKLRQTILLDSSRRWVGFADENCEDVPSPRNTTNALLYLGSWTSCSLVVLSENDDFRAQISGLCPTLSVMSTLEFIQEFCHPSRGGFPQDHYDRLMVAVESATNALKGVGDLNSSSSLPDLVLVPAGVKKQGKLKCVGPRIAFVNNDIVPSAELRRNAMHGDLVEIAPVVLADSALLQASASNEESSEIKSSNKHVAHYVTRIIKRAEIRHLVATLDAKEAEALASGGGESSLRRLLCVPMDDRFPKARIATRLGQSLVGKRFVMAIVDWPENSNWPNARYVRTIGNANELTTESSSILVECELDSHERPFPASALAELPAKDVIEFSPDSDSLRAKDFRDRRVMSIDPIGCQDIDDAISLRTNPDGTHELAVHIADVARFVKSGSHLDREAYSRATSVYLQERRLDMLPALLCEDLCSLRPRLDRFAVSAVFQVSASFDVDLQSVQFTRTLIHSRYALAYEQAQNLVENKPAGEFTQGKGWTGGVVDEADYEWIRPTIRSLMEIARKREHQRKGRGAVNLESAGEYKFAINSEMKPTRVQAYNHMEIHDTVAELMILANEAAARVMLAKTPTRALLRHHPPADIARFKPVIEFAKRLGFEFKASSNKEVAMSLARIREGCEDIGAVKVVESLATRAMSEAQYISSGTARHEMGNESPFYHFGLGLDFYTHFTSPIRRYADVIVARLLMEEQPPVQIPNKVDGSDARHDPHSKEEVALDKASDDSFWAKALGNEEDEVEEIVLKPSKQQGWSVTSKPAAAFRQGEEEDLSWAKALGEASDEEDEVDTPPKQVVAQPPPPKAPENDFADLLNWISPSETAPRVAEPITIDAHGTTQGVQDACDHINRRHRSAKEASAKSQALFFALYFAENAREVGAIVLSVVSDGIVCFSPEFDLRILLKLVQADRAINQKAFTDPAKVNGVEIVEERSVTITTVNAGLVKFEQMDQITLKLTCDLGQDEQASAPDPRLPPVRGQLVIGVSSSSKKNIVASGKAAVKQSVIATQDMSVSASPAHMPQRKTLYATLQKEKSRIDAPVSHVYSPAKLTQVTKRMCFGGFVPKKHHERLLEPYVKEEEEDYPSQSESSRHSRTSASTMSAAEMKRLEKQAIARIEKLQAERYDSLVKRRMKKDG